MEKQIEVNDNKTTSVLKAAWLIAVVTIVSKLIGFVRDVIIANYYGASLVSDAYYYAYQIPSLSLILLGGVGVGVEGIDLLLALGENVLDGLEKEFLEQIHLNEKIQNLCDEGPAFKGYQGLIGQGCRLLSDCGLPITACPGTGWAPQRSEAGR